MDVSDVFMSRCLALAAHGRGLVAPNPMVGAVLVADGQIIGEGFHRCFGEAHAEVNAIASVKTEALLKRATLYVNLEPCSHVGKTPPCTDLILQKGIPHVVVACEDPYPDVAGRGIKKLRDAGVAVKTGMMAREARVLNRFFMTAHRYHRPYIILKWAQSEDGFIDRTRKEASEKPVVFSTVLTRMMVHKIRAEVQAVLVGAHTAILDNPSLTVRYWAGKSPVRILIERSRRVPEACKRFDGEQQTLVFTEPADLTEVLTSLYEKGIHSVLVEGGATLHRAFLKENRWDELRIEIAPILLKDGVKAACIPACDNLQLADRQIVYESPARCGKPTIIEHYINYTF